MLCMIDRDLNGAGTARSEGITGSNHNLKTDSREGFLPQCSVNIASRVTSLLCPQRNMAPQMAALTMQFQSQILQHGSSLSVLVHQASATAVIRLSRITCSI